MSEIILDMMLNGRWIIVWLLYYIVQLHLFCANFWSSKTFAKRAMQVYSTLNNLWLFTGEFYLLRICAIYWVVLYAYEQVFILLNRKVICLSLTISKMSHKSVYIFISFVARCDMYSKVFALSRTFLLFFSCHIDIQTTRLGIL